MDIHRVANDKRRALVTAQHAGRYGPGNLQLRHVAFIDLLERRVSARASYVRAGSCPILRIFRRFDESVIGICGSCGERRDRANGAEFDAADNASCVLPATVVGCTDASKPNASVASRRRPVLGNRFPTACHGIGNSRGNIFLSPEPNLRRFCQQSLATGVLEVGNQKAMLRPTSRIRNLKILFRSISIWNSFRLKPCVGSVSFATQGLEFSCALARGGQQIGRVCVKSASLHRARRQQPAAC